ncbi:hypothetical protein E4U17_001135 [Claviceps sp. LM77 group G4]|nr:hypothetical protein E4U17_001135 [Claviceps sp. LM77 group G4]KAG6081395.1 hypothetical protein E4U16_007494 [Claviceps sp. LM84 group G4]KAG6086213.1 hypothetical protein E4U33_007327 [Claviceps sp. LM78 group G4]
MASQTPSSGTPWPRKPTQEASASGAKDPVDDLLLLVENFALSPSFTELKSMRRDLRHERETSRRTEIAYDRNLVELTGCQVQLKQQKELLEKATAENKAVQAKLQAQQQECAAQAASIREQHGHIEDFVAEVQAKNQHIAALEVIRQDRDAIQVELASRGVQLASTTEALHTVQEQLEQLEAFRVTMPQLDNEKIEAICHLLDSHFHHAYRFMEDQLDRDLEESLLKNHLAWDDIRSNASIQHITPLCASNSRAARRMRVAAGLAAYAKALDKYVFKPVYMTSCTDEIDHILNTLWNEDPSHEFFVRSVLLKILPQTQDEKKQARVREVVENVHRTLDLWVSSAHREHFKAGLEVLCEHMCQAWMQIQHLRDRVRPSFSFSYHGGWRPLPVSPMMATEDTTATASASVSSPALASASNNDNDDMNNDDNEINNSNSNKSERSAKGLPRRQDIGKVVWPSFLYHHPEDEHDDEELLLPGYFLTDAQTAEAENEEESPRRQARRTTRNLDKAAGKRRRDSGIFLSTGGV